MVFVIYDKYNYKCYFVEGQSINDFKLKPNEVIKEHNSNDLSQTDIRAYNDDGSVKTLEEQLKEKIIALKDNEIIDNGIIRELNKNYEDDYIVMIERGLDNLDKGKKISEKNGKKYIIEKTIEEKYQENLITKEEYNSCIINQRQSEYSQNLDGVRAELLDSVLNNCASKGLLNENQIEVLKTIEDNRAKIKTQYKKIL
ncbi:phage tail protein [Brachyspira pilosicoli]|uniref:phage tail protein n=1 Tax=Brachyspira pilosicoli TaxID=52584 RepID=UPI0025437E1E|nr:phage tail protein [Brachyspira pilosicoli]WIH87493.1 phage tail protein [Brachyspira pilosicoli]